ncbi:MAG: DeoR/GlpR transcriptional regulator [Mycobacteriaceae bacterium]|nr:DeoR/GlpR transcriptional regulator [Mycobacteriaceae bacterium]
MTTHADGRAGRWGRLLELLADGGRLTVDDAARRLGVSVATVRRDFTALADQQLATRTHGGIIATSVAYNLPARYRHLDNADSKRRVAEHTADLVAHTAVVGINGGTTTTEVARALAARPAPTTGSDNRPTIVTNALNIASELVLRPHLRTICLGGVAREESYELHGPFAERVLADLRMDDLVLGVYAITAEGGAQCRHLGEAGITAAMVQRSQRVIVAATAEKLTRQALARICPADNVDILVTDTDAEPDAIAALRAAGVRVDLV